MNTAGNAPLSADLAWPNRLPGSGTIRVRRKLNSTKVIDALTDLFILRGVPAYIQSGNGPEFIAEAVRNWIKAVGAKTAYIEPGSPWENGYCESFNGRMRDELPNGEVFSHCAKPRSSSKAGGTTTTPNDHTVLWATARLRPKPSSRWTKGQPCTNFQLGPLKWGCSKDNGAKSTLPDCL